MEPLQVNKAVIKAILTGSYTHSDLRQFLRLCYNLALPLVRKRIALGKLNLGVLGLQENDVIQDIFAELFRRDDRNNFPELQQFFESSISDFETLSEAEVIHELWRLVCITVKNETIRLYTEIDPTLARILRNTKFAVEKTGLFREVDRFGQEHLVPCNVDPRFELPPLDPEYLAAQFSRRVSLRDNTLEMVRKLHCVITQEDNYQKAVPLVTAALMFKKVFSLDSKIEEATLNEVENTLVKNDVMRAAERVCAQLHEELQERYVGKRKKSEEVFDKYMLAMKDILIGSLDDDSFAQVSLFEHLCKYSPGLTKEEYRKEHQTTLEYFVKIGKSRIKDEFRAQ